MNKIRGIGFVVCLISALLVITGCYDSREIDETGYMIAMGIDKGKQPNHLRFTFQFSNPLATGGGEESSGGGKGADKGEEQTDGEVWDSGNPTVTNITVEAPNYYIAGNLLHDFMSKQPNLSHIKLIVFSTDLAREGILEHSQLLMQEREIRPNTNIAVARTSAEAFLKSVNPKLEENTAKYYELLTKDDTMVYAPMVELREFVDSMTGQARSPVLPLAGVSASRNKLEAAEETFEDSSQDRTIRNAYFAAGEIPRLSDVKSEIIGIAVFRDKKMVGELNGDAAMLYRILCGEVKTAFFSVPDLHDAEKDITFQIWMNKKPRYQVNLEDGVPRISVDLDVNANFLGAQISESWDYDRLEQYAQQILLEELQNFLQQTCMEYQADILGFGNVAKRQCLTWRQWENLDWKTCYKQAKFDLNVQLKIRRGGTTLPLSIE